MVKNILSYVKSNERAQSIKNIKCFLHVAYFSSQALLVFHGFMQSLVVNELQISINRAMLALLIIKIEVNTHYYFVAKDASFAFFL